MTRRGAHGGAERGWGRNHGLRTWFWTARTICSTGRERGVEHLWPRNLGQFWCARARVTRAARALARERRGPEACSMQKGCRGRGWTSWGRLELAENVAPTSVTPSSVPRAQFWHATACWRALGHFGRV